LFWAVARQLVAVRGLVAYTVRTVPALFRCKAEEERARCEARIAEVQKERDNAQQECEDLKLQLSLSEDRVDSVQSQLQETIRKLKEGELPRDGKCSVRKNLAI